MDAITFFVFCVASCFVQCISAQCIGSGFLADEIALAGGAFGYPAYGVAPLADGAFGIPGLPFGAAPCGAYGGSASGFIAPTNGGSFAVTSTSPISPTGITVISENAIEGPLTIIGELPFLGAVALEGALESLGAGGINYGCGNGAVGIVSEGVSPYGIGIAPAAAMAAGRYGPAGAPGFGYNGIPAGCGYGPIY